MMMLMVVGMVVMLNDETINDKKKCVVTRKAIVKFDREISWQAIGLDI